MDRLAREELLVAWDGPGPEETCCTNCEYFDGKWCEIKDYRVMRPWSFRCIDFTKEGNNEA